MTMEIINRWTTANDGILGVVSVNGHEIMADWATCTVYVNGEAFNSAPVDHCGRTRMREMFDDAIERHSAK